MAITTKPTSYSVVVAHEKCPDHLWMLDENSGIVSQDKGKSATKLDMNLYESDVTSANLWSTDTLGTVINCRDATVSSNRYAMSNTHTFEAANSVLLVAYVKTTNTSNSGVTNEFIISTANSVTSSTYPRFAARGQPQFDALADGYAHDGVSGFSINGANSAQRLYNQNWVMVSAKFKSGEMAIACNGANWLVSNSSASSMVFPSATSSKPNRYGIGTMPALAPFGNANMDVLAAMVFVDNYDAWDNTFISNLFSDPWQFLTSSSPPAFLVAPAVSSKTNSAYTISFTTSTSCVMYAVAVASGTTAPSISQIKSGLDSNGSPAKATNTKSVSGASTITLTPTDSPAFPRYDLYFVLNSSGGDSSRISLANEYLNPPTGKSFTTLTSVDTTSPFYGTGVDVNDTVVIDTNTTPDSYNVNCAVDGTVSYDASGASARQFIDINVYDYSLGTYFGAGTLVFNNYGPSGPVFSEPFLYQKDVPIITLDLRPFAPDPEGDPVTVVVLDALPAGLIIYDSQVTGTPTEYGTTNTQFQWADLYGSTYEESATIQVGDVVPNVIGNIQATAISTITGIASFTANVINISSPDIASGIVISTDPLADTLVVYNREITLYVSNGSTIHATTLGLPDGLRNTGYSAQLTADGEVTAWTLESGNLPPGLSLNGVTGTISGIPTTAGTYIFNVGCTNGITSDTQSLSIRILFGQTTTPGSTPSITVYPPINDAIAVVGNVSIGSIEGLYVQFPGYGYRTYTNTQAIVYRSAGDDPTANQSTDIRVSGITTANAFLNTNSRFVETIMVDKMPVGYASNLTLANTGDWNLFSANVKNIAVTLNGTPGSGSDKWHQFEDWYADSDGSYETANITGKILTANTSWTGSPATVVLYAVANTAARPLTLLVGNLITTVNSTQNYTVDAITDYQTDVNANSPFCSALSFEHIETGGVALYNIINGGHGFRTTPTVSTKSYHDTYLSETYAYGTPDYANTRQLMNSTGQIAHVYISSGGSGYANDEPVIVSGSGYGFTGNIIAGANGTVTGVIISSRGEGYYGSISANVTSANGSGVVLVPYGFGEGVVAGVETGAIGRVKDIRMVYRGAGYTITPIISLKVVDMIINGIDDNESINEGDRVYQGDTLATASFQGIVKSYNRNTNLLRLFNYSGNSYENFEPSLEFTSTRGVLFTVNTAATVPAPDAYPEAIKATGLPNPWFYGNGKAKGIADFYNGLIKFNGFYVNTDGFLSSDKKIQDKNTYHNYSYVVESEKMLADYSSTLRDIIHPAGMAMLGRTISKSELSEEIVSDSDVIIVPSINIDSTVTVANSYGITVIGANSEFDTIATPGDMILVMDDVHPLRSAAKVILTVDSESSMWVESNFVYVGQGKISTNAGNNIVHISGNTNAISDFIATGDNIRINVGNVEIYQVTAVAANTLSINNAANTTNTELVYHVVPDYTTDMEYKIIKVSE